MKRKIQIFLHRHPMAPTYFGLAWNLVYALINGLLGLAYGSRWFLAMCAYHAVLGLVRLGIVSHEKSPQREDRSILKNIGRTVILLAFIMGGIVLLTIEEQRNLKLDPCFMILLAAGTVMYVGWTITNIQGVRKEKSVFRVSLRNISGVCAVGALLSLERTLLGTFGAADSEGAVTLEIVTGAAAVLMIAAIGGQLIKIGNSSPPGKAGRRRRDEK